MSTLSYNLNLDQSSLASAIELFVKELNQGDVVALEGNLGSGKTTFAKALIRTLTNNSSLEVTSPTFNIVYEYNGISCPIYHFDLYRISAIEELYEIGLEEMVKNGISVIEWPEIAINLLPEPKVSVKIDYVNEMGLRNYFIKIFKKYSEVKK